MNNAANIILIETISNGASPSKTSSLKKRNDPPHRIETNNKVRKSTSFMSKKKGLLIKRPLCKPKFTVGRD